MLRPLGILVVLLLIGPVIARAGEVLYVAPDLYRQQATTDRDEAKAAELLDGAKAAADEGQVSRALALVTEALRHNPDEPTCRRVLGYEQHGGRWLTAYQKKQVDRGLVWAPEFGWLRPEDLPRYVAGERRAGRRWLSVEEDAARHAAIENGWQVRTDNFQVTTNHSLAAAATLAAELEQLYQVWRQLFAGYHLGADEVRGRFAGTRKARVRSRPLNVLYHRDRSGYVAALQAKQPRIAETLGIYFDDMREAHFFATAEGGGGKGERASDASSAFHLPPSVQRFITKPCISFFRRAGGTSGTSARSTTSGRSRALPRTSSR